MSALKIDRKFLDELRTRVRISDLVGRYVRLERRGQEYWGLCPFHNERTASFKVDDRRGFYHCFGCNAHGDAIRFVCEVESLSFSEAVTRLAEESGDLSHVHVRTDLPAGVRSEPGFPPVSNAADALNRRTTFAWIKQILDASPPASGTLVEAYLRQRGIRAPAPPALRFALRLWHAESRTHLPAMVAAVQQVDGAITGIHRTYLAADGHAKAAVSSPKKMAGKCAGGAVRLCDPTERLAIAEGIETALSVMVSVPDLPVWAALSLGNMSGGGVGRGAAHPSPKRIGHRLPSTRPDLSKPGIRLPAFVKEVILIADADNADPHTAEALLRRAANRFLAEGRAVRIMRPPEGMDFNDMLMARPMVSEDVA